MNTKIQALFDTEEETEFYKGLLEVTDAPLFLLDKDQVTEIRVRQFGQEAG